jgi:hypothetical protein
MRGRRARCVERRDACWLDLIDQRPGDAAKWPGVFFLTVVIVVALASIARSAEPDREKLAGHD